MFNFCQTQFNESFSCLIHLKTIRVWVESVLRFALPAKFSVTLIRPHNMKNESKLRKTLAEMCTDLGGDIFTEEIGGGGDENQGISLVNEKFYPYVFVDVNLKV